MTPFKIGGFYKMNDGRLIRLDPTSPYTGTEARAGEAFACSLNRASCHAAFNLTTGVSAGGGRFLRPIELNAQGEPIAPTFYCAAETIKPASKTPTLDKLANTADPKRPPLEWARSKAPDRFPGYSILRDTATPDHAYSHPLTRVADAGAQVSAEFGSAWLVVR